VIGDFHDTYKNLSLKTFTAHSFINSNFFETCKNDYFVFHDDDTFVNYKLLVNNIKSGKTQEMDFSVKY